MAKRKHGYGSIRHTKKRIARALVREGQSAGGYKQRAIRTSGVVFRMAEGFTDKGNFRAYVCPSNLSNERLHNPNGMPDRQRTNRRCGEGTGMSPTAAYKKATLAMLRKMR